MKGREGLLAELWPTGSFGGPRPGARVPGEPDPAGPDRGAELARVVAEIDREHGYGVHLRYRKPAA
ncbi:hypothetical protein ACIGZH_01825 [Streptomyces sp. NPDC058319]|uniref:hypothetical protein n=1 Tax=unclassified Streptomyces TaxID=2593676 RepID=UPI0036E1DABD